MKRRLKTFLILVAIFLLPMLWLLVSHIVAKHALEHYKAQLRAAGEKLTVDELLPPQIPPDQNGATLLAQTHPYFLLEGVLNSNPPPAMRTMPPNKAMIGWQQPKIVSQDGHGLITNTWQDIEQELKKVAAGLELLHQVATRPGFELKVDYHNGAMPGLTNLADLKRAVLLLSAAAVSDLHHGDTPSAVTNVHALVVLVDQTKDERLFISQLVRIGMVAIASTPQWEVLQSTNLTDPELAMLQHDWESMDVIQPMENAFKMDRLWSLAEIDQLRTSNSPSASIGLDNPLGANGSDVLDYVKDLGGMASRAASDTIWRVSWSYDDALRELQASQVAVETLRQIETNGSFDKALAEQDRKIKALGLYSRTNNWLRTRFNNNFLALFDSTPVTTGRSINRMLRAEATRRVTITAIALRRYQLRHGAWPADLNALSPEFLSEVPRDPADGQPLYYQANPDGTFTLYSGSWTWPQPATPEEIEQYYQTLQQRTSVYR